MTLWDISEWCYKPGGLSYGGLKMEGPLWRDQVYKLDKVLG